MKELYKPVSCDTHSQLELCIMHDKQLRIEFTQKQEQFTVTLKPSDIVSRKEEGEFLLAVDKLGNNYEIRLDNILSFQEL